jgi:hypothetical protein
MRATQDPTTGRFVRPHGLNQFERWPCNSSSSAAPEDVSLSSAERLSQITLPVADWFEHFEAGDFDNAFGVAIQGDGRIVIAGHAVVFGTGDFALARYTVCALRRGDPRSPAHSRLAAVPVGRPHSYVGYGFWVEDGY